MIAKLTRIVLPFLRSFKICAGSYCNFFSISFASGFKRVFFDSAFSFYKYQIERFTHFVSIKNRQTSMTTLKFVVNL